MSIVVDNMANEIMKTLNEYKEVIEEEVQQAIEETSKEAVKELKNTSQKGKRGLYKKSWKREKERFKNGFCRTIIYSDEYRLTHLLENGHALKRGGRTVGSTRAFPHIKNVEVKSIKMLEEKIGICIQEASK